jgi:hypothetical protein
VGFELEVVVIPPGDHEPTSGSQPCTAPTEPEVIVDVEELAHLLHETSVRHGEFEAVAEQHDWWDWYAAYMHARMQGTGPDEAAQSADEFMARVRHVHKS